MQYKKVLTIAGSDSGGGAGIQADIKTISALGCYAASAITAVTIQNTLGVQSVVAVPAEAVAAQTEAVLSDIGADAVKIGMLHSAEIVRSVAEVLKRFEAKNVVLDTVLVSTSGRRLLSEEGVEAMKERLFPLATLVTPNIPEAMVLSGETIESVEDMKRVSERLSKRYGTSFLIKGGHLSGELMTDVLYDCRTGLHSEYPARKIATRNTHGTGCTLSSAIASYLSKDVRLELAVYEAKEYLSMALASGADGQIGGGKGPVDHFYFMKNDN